MVCASFSGPTFLCGTFFLIFGNISGFGSRGLWTVLTPGPIRASTTWAQCLLESSGRFLHLLTMRTQALHTWPARTSSSLKHSGKWLSYLALLVNLELKGSTLILIFIFMSYIYCHILSYLLDFALQMQHPACDLYSLGLWKAAMGLLKITIVTTGVWSGVNPLTCRLKQLSEDSHTHHLSLTLCLHKIFPL